MSVQVVSHPGHDSLKILKEEGTLDFFKFVKMFYLSQKRRLQFYICKRGEGPGI